MVRVNHLYELPHQAWDHVQHGALLQGLCQSRKIHHVLSAEQDDFCASRERHKQFKERDIKGKGGQCWHYIYSRKVELAHGRIDDVDGIAMLDENRLRSSRRP